MGNLGSGSGSSYPGNLDTQTLPEIDAPSSNKTKARAGVPNDLAAAVIAVEGALGKNPQGIKTDVKTFLQVQHNTDGTHKSFNLVGNVTGNVTGNCTGSSGSCTGNSATASTANQVVPVTSSYTAKNFADGESWYVPAGTYYMVPGNNPIHLKLGILHGSVGLCVNYWAGGAIISDGINVVIKTDPGTTDVLYYYKFT